jgi:hypothetical protein
MASIKLMSSLSGLIVRIVGFTCLRCWHESQIPIHLIFQRIPPEKQGQKKHGPFTMQESGVLFPFAPDAADDSRPHIPNRGHFSHFDRIESSSQVLTIFIR